MTELLNQLARTVKRYSPKILMSILIFGYLCISFTHAVTMDEILSAITNEDEITLNLIPERRYEVEDSSSSAENRFISVYWTGYIPYSCANLTPGHTSLGDFFSLSMSIVSHDAVYPVSETAEAYREKSLNLHGITPYISYDLLPGGVISEGKREVDSQTNYHCNIYAWIDPHTEIRVYVDGSVKKSIDKFGCSPLYAERDVNMQNLVKSEAVRISNLLYKRLTGTDTIPPDTELVNKKEIAQDRLRYAHEIRDDYEKHWNNVVLKEVTGGVFGDVNLFDAQYSASNPLKIPTLDDTLKGSFFSLWTNGLDKMQAAWEREDYDEVVSVYEQTYNEQREIVKSLLGGESKSESDPSSEKEDPKPLSLEAALVSQKTHLYHDVPISE